MNRMLLMLVLLTTHASCSTVSSNNENRSTNLNLGTHTMDLGNFSISLTVKDLAISHAFYEKLGFAQIGGEPEQKWLILRNGDSTIGLFQGMFEENIMTFNPGWARDGDHPDEFTDIRNLQQKMKATGLVLTSEADETSTGPASLVLVDPDGNQILIDQHR